MKAAFLIALLVCCGGGLAADDRPQIEITGPMQGDQSFTFSGAFCKYDAPTLDGHFRATAGYSDVKIRARFSNSSGAEATATIDLKHIGPDDNPRVYKDLLWMIGNGLRSCNNMYLSLDFVSAGESDEMRDARMARELADEEEMARNRDELIRKRAVVAKRQAAEAAAHRKADEEARGRREALELEERRQEMERARAYCAEVYKRTANKKLSDVTVAEDEEIRSCRGRRLYY